MGLLARFLLGRPRNPEEIPDLSVDLAALTIAGLGSGSERAAVLERFGPPEDFWAQRRGSLRYPRLGLGIRLDGARSLAGFDVIAVPDPLAVVRTSSFPGVWLPGASTSPPDEAAIVRVLGRPDRRLVDEEEICLEWSRPPRFAGADFSLDGRLTVFVVDFDAGAEKPHR